MAVAAEEEEEEEKKEEEEEEAGRWEDARPPRRLEEKDPGRTAPPDFTNAEAGDMRISIRLFAFCCDAAGDLS